MKKSFAKYLSILFTSILLVQVALVGVPTFAEEQELGVNLLENPSFEELDGNKAVGWEAKNGWNTDAVSISDEAAKTGDNGLEIVIDNNDDHWIRQTVEIEGGKAYELSTWLKSDISSTGRAQIKLEFYHDTTDRDGWEDQIFSDGLPDSFDDWGNINLRVETPPNANLAQVYLRLYGPGTAYYDDVSFHRIDKIEEIGVNIATDETFYYENVTKGTVAGTIFPDDGTFEDKTVDVQIYPEEGGDPILHEEGLSATEDFQYAFDPQDMNMQEPYILEVILRSAQGEQLYADSEKIYRWERPRSFQEDGTLIVDGEPFFPIIGYHVPVEDYGKVTETINTLQGLHGNNERFDHDKTQYSLDEAHKHGLKVMVPIYPDVWNLEGGRGYEYVREKVSMFKDHPAVIGWMIQDEPNKFEDQGHTTIHEDLTEVYRLIRSIDPVHPTYMVINSIHGFNTFGRLTDIVVTDPYPLPADPISMVSEHVREAKTANPENPVWNILQTFKLPENDRYPYLPNTLELRHMAYQSILEGAQGLGYYSYTDPSWDLIDSELYPGLLDFSKTEVPYISDFVANGEQIDQHKDEQVQWGLWEENNELYVAVLNLTEEAQTATVKLSENGYQVEVIAPDRSEYHIFNNELTVELSGLEATLIKLTPAKSSADLIKRVEKLKDDDAFENADISRSLSLHLTAVDRFEQQGKVEKVVKHMNGFKMLLENHKQNNVISTEAYEELKKDTNVLLQRMKESLLQTMVQVENPQVIAGEMLQVNVQLENTSEEPIEDLSLSLNWPDAFLNDSEHKNVKELEPGESTEVIFEVEVPKDVSTGSYQFTMDVQFNHAGEGYSYLRERNVDVLPFIKAYRTTKQINAKYAGNHPVSFTLKNNASDTADITLNSIASEDITLDLDGSHVTIDSNEIAEMEGDVQVSKDVPEGEHEITIQVMVDNEVVEEIPITVILDFNLITNPGFEQLEAGIPIEWEAAHNGWSTGKVSLSNEAHTGENSVKIVADRNEENRLKHLVVGLEGGQTYDLSAWLKSDIESNGKVQMKVEFYKDEFGREGAVGEEFSIFSDEYGSFADWEKIGMKLDVPEEANRASILLRMYGPGTAYFDDVSLVLNKNKIENPGFEEGDSSPDAWYIQSTANWEWVQDEVHSGKYAITLFPGPRGTSDISSKGKIPMTAGKSYRVSFWAKNDSTNGGSFGIRRSDSNDKSIDYIWKDVERESDWTKHSFTFEPTSETESVWIYLRLDEGSDGQIWFDDILLEEVEEE